MLCDRPSLPLVEQSLRQNRSQLMRMPQVHYAESYLSTDTIDLLRKEIGLQTRRPPAGHLCDVDHIRADLAIIRERDLAPAAGWKSCGYPALSDQPAPDQPPALDLPLAPEAGRPLPQPDRPASPASKSTPAPASVTAVHRPRHGGGDRRNGEIGNRCLLYQG